MQDATCRLVVLGSLSSTRVPAGNTGSGSIPQETPALPWTCQAWDFQYTQRRLTDTAGHDRVQKLAAAVTQRQQWGSRAPVRAPQAWDGTLSSQLRSARAQGLLMPPDHSPVVQAPAGLW